MSSDSDSDFFDASAANMPRSASGVSAFSSDALTPRLHQRSISQPESFAKASNPAQLHLSTASDVNPMFLTANQRRMSLLHSTTINVGHSIGNHAHPSNLPGNATRRQSMMVRHPTLDADPMEMVRQLAEKRKREQEEREKAEQERLEEEKKREAVRLKNDKVDASNIDTESHLPLEEQVTAEVEDASDSSPHKPLMLEASVSPSLTNADEINNSSNIPKLIIETPQESAPVRTHSKSQSDPVTPTITITSNFKEDYSGKMNEENSSFISNRRRRGISQPPVPIIDNNDILVNRKRRSATNEFPDDLSMINRSRRSATNLSLSEDMEKVRREMLGITDTNSDAISVNLNLDEARASADQENADNMEGSQPEAPSLLVRDIETGELISLSNLNGVADRAALDLVAKSGGRMDHLDHVLMSALSESPMGTFLRKEPSFVKEDKKQKGLFGRFLKKKQSSDHTNSITSMIASSNTSSIDLTQVSSTSDNTNYPGTRQRTSTFSTIASDSAGSPFIKVKVKGKKNCRLSQLRIAQDLIMPFTDDKSLQTKGSIFFCPWNFI